jgi:predicted transport protein
MGDTAEKNNIEIIDIVKLYNKIRKEVLSWDKRINEGETQTDITFSLNRVFLRIGFPKSKNGITLKIMTPEGKALKDPFKKAKPGKPTGGKSLKYLYSTLSLSPNDDIYYALSLIKQAYDFNKNKD